MYNKKCKNTFLFLMALLCLITLIVPFMQVGFFGNTSIILKIVYYFTLVVFTICLVAIILIGIISLFKNNYMLLPFQEFLAYVALFMLLLNLIVFAPINNVILSVGYSILAIETFIMACLDEILKLIKKLPRSFKNLVKTIKLEKEEKLQKQLQITSEENLTEKPEEKVVEVTFTQTSMLEGDEVKIIPPDEDLI